CQLHRHTVLRMSFFLMIFSFFFSSRRRHTRSTRDWSSDVCSSDLAVLRCNAAFAEVQPLVGVVGEDPDAVAPAVLEDRALLVARSEERRVGKGVGRGGRRWVKKKRMRSGRGATSMRE